jgi:hypothetical protein
MIHLFRQPEPKEYCVIGADPAEGGDNSSFVVLSKVYADVLMIGKSKEESSQLGYSLNKVGEYLKSKTDRFPCIAVERNIGAATIYVLKELNYPNLFKMPKTFVQEQEDKSENFGWHTNQATRPKMLDDLGLAIRQKLLKIPSKDLVDEINTFIRNEKTGKPEAEVGCKDDLVISLAIAWQVYQIEQTPDENVSSIAIVRNKKIRDSFANILS